MENNKNSLPERGVRAAPNESEMRVFPQAAMREGGTRQVPAAARQFARRFSLTLTHYPDRRELPNWLRAMVEKKVSVEELTKALHDRLHRAPTEENQGLALVMANEIARMKGGPEALAKYTTPELLERLSARREAE